MKKAKLVPLYFAAANERERGEFDEQLGRLKEFYGDVAEFMQPVCVGGAVPPDADAAVFPQLIGAAFSESEALGKINLPFVVLVNGYSASAAEIASGAIQVAGKAPIVGTTTYGKGVVQHYYELDGGTSLKLTSSKYYLANDESPHGIGIKPDYEVSLPADTAEKGGVISQAEDTQLQKALELLGG